MHFSMLIIHIHFKPVVCALIRIVPSTGGPQSLFGLPDVEIFAFRLSPAIILGMVLLTLGLGIRGLIAGVILYYIWASNSSSPSGVQRPGTANNLINQLQAGIGQLGSNVGLGPQGSSGPVSGGQRPEGDDLGAAGHKGGQIFKGHGNRLGGKS